MMSREKQQRIALEAYRLVAEARTGADVATHTQEAPLPQAPTFLTPSPEAANIHALIDKANAELFTIRVQVAELRADIEKLDEHSGVTRVNWLGWVTLTAIGSQIAYTILH